jgi:hypothetical protein
VRDITYLLAVKTDSRGNAAGVSLTQVIETIRDFRFHFCVRRRARKSEDLRG